MKYSLLFCKTPGDAQNHGALDTHVNDLPEPFLVFIIVSHCLSLAYIILKFFFAIGCIGSLLNHLLLATALEHISPVKTSFIISPLHLCILKFLL